MLLLRIVFLCACLVIVSSNIGGGGGGGGGGPALYYKGAAGEVFGPFPAEQVYDWWTSGYFSNNVPVSLDPYFESSSYSVAHYFSSSSQQQQDQDQDQQQQDDKYLQQGYPGDYSDDERGSIGGGGGAADGYGGGGYGENTPWAIAAERRSKLASDISSSLSRFGKKALGKFSELKEKVQQQKGELLEQWQQRQQRQKMLQYQQQQQQYSPSSYAPAPGQYPQQQQQHQQHHQQYHHQQQQEQQRFGQQENSDSNVHAEAGADMLPSLPQHHQHQHQQPLQQQPTWDLEPPPTTDAKDLAAEEATRGLERGGEGYDDDWDRFWSKEAATATTTAGTTTTATAAAKTASKESLDSRHELEEEIDALFASSPKPLHTVPSSSAATATAVPTATATTKFAVEEEEEEGGASAQHQREQQRFEGEEDRNSFENGNGGGDNENPLFAAAAAAVAANKPQIPPTSLPSTLSQQQHAYDEFTSASASTVKSSEHQQQQHYQQQQHEQQQRWQKNGQSDVTAGKEKGFPATTRATNSQGHNQHQHQQQHQQQQQQQRRGQNSSSNGDSESRKGEDVQRHASSSTSAPTHPNPASSSSSSSSSSTFPSFSSSSFFSSKESTGKISVKSMGSKEDRSLWDDVDAGSYDDAEISPPRSHFSVFKRLKISVPSMFNLGRFSKKMLPHGLFGSHTSSRVDSSPPNNNVHHQQQQQQQQQQHYHHQQQQQTHTKTRNMLLKMAIPLTIRTCLSALPQVLISAFPPVAAASLLIILRGAVISFALLMASLALQTLAGIGSGGLDSASFASQVGEAAAAAATATSAAAAAAAAAAAEAATSEATEATIGLGVVGETVLESLSRQDGDLPAGSEMLEMINHVKGSLFSSFSSLSSLLPEQITGPISEFFAAIKVATNSLSKHTPILICVCMLATITIIDGALLPALRNASIKRCVKREEGRLKSQVEDDDAASKFTVAANKKTAAASTTLLAIRAAAASKVKIIFSVASSLYTSTWMLLAAVFAHYFASHLSTAPAPGVNGLRLSSSRVTAGGAIVVPLLLAAGLSILEMLFSSLEEPASSTLTLQGEEGTSPTNTLHLEHRIDYLRQLTMSDEASRWGLQTYVQQLKANLIRKLKMQQQVSVDISSARGVQPSNHFREASGGSFRRFLSTMLVATASALTAGKVLDSLSKKILSLSESDATNKGEQDFFSLLGLKDLMVKLGGASISSGSTNSLTNGVLLVCLLIAPLALWLQFLSSHERFLEAAIESENSQHEIKRSQQPIIAPSPFVSSSITRLGGSAHDESDIGGWKTDGPDKPSGISLSRVTLFSRNRYPIKDLSVHLPAGAITVIVGSELSGKGDLLAALHRDRGVVVHGGSIDIHGRESKEWNREALQSRIVLLRENEEEFALHAGVVAGCLPNLPRDALDRHYKAAEATGARYILTSLGEGPASLLGSLASGTSGVLLSSSEWRSLALCRALGCLDKDIVLLDALCDTLSEAQEAHVFALLRASLRSDQVVVVTSARFASARHADFVVVLNNKGQLVNTGSFLDVSSKARVTQL